MGGGTGVGHLVRRGRSVGRRCAAAGQPPAALAAPLFAAVIPRLTPSLLLGIGGPPGSGKSTLAAALVHLAGQRGVAALALSLDDFYFGRAQRRGLARTVHPLFATRGAPGTHDVDLLLSTLDALPSASPRRPVAVPRFDKGRDTRLPRSRWRQVIQPPRLLVLEGWCLGFSPQPSAALRKAVNVLEREEDGQCGWREAVNRQVEIYAQRVSPRLQALLWLQAPDWTAVRRWRSAAERSLRAAGAPRAMGSDELRRFLWHYQRWVVYAIDHPPARADWTVALDRQRRVLRAVGPDC